MAAAKLERSPTVKTLIQTHSAIEDRAAKLITLEPDKSGPRRRRQPRKDIITVASRASLHKTERARGSLSTASVNEKTRQPRWLSMACVARSRQPMPEKAVDDLRAIKPISMELKTLLTHRKQSTERVGRNPHHRHCHQGLYHRKAPDHNPADQMCNRHLKKLHEK